MFLRRMSKRAGGERYDYWALCESVRTSKGPRQRIVATLGKLDVDEAYAGWDQVDALLEGREPRGRARQLRLGEESTSTSSGGSWELANLRDLRVERSRSFGGVYLALSLWRRLGLHRLLDELLPKDQARVRWSDLASILVCARFCGQDSELKIAEGWYQSTALEDLLSIDPAHINDDRLYRGLDALGQHKDRIFEHLMERYRDWLGVKFEFLLYDVTSTFFEGQAAGNDLAARGYSRDHRPDCKQVCIGLVCTPEGLPLSFEVFAGNRPDVTTVEQMVELMEKTYGQAERIWVMDRGMVSGKNIEFLRSRGAFYVVGTPKSQLRKVEAALLDNDQWEEVNPGLEARLVEHPDGLGEETFVLCRSTDRAGKEQGIFDRQARALTHELLKIDSALRKRPQADLEKLQRRIGRWLGRYPKAAAVTHANLLGDQDGRAIGLQIYTDLAKGQMLSRSWGAYLLRTNCQETDPAKIWKWYVQLTQAEAAFRTTKSDSGLRPIYHQRADRVEAHILVCFLALALWRSLEMWMSAKGLGTCARKLVERIGRIQSMDVIVPIQREGHITEARIRTVAKPDQAEAQLLAHLGLALPARNWFVEM